MLANGRSRGSETAGAAVLLAAMATLCALGLAGTLRDGRAGQAGALEPGRSARWYEAYGEATLARGDVSGALDAARLEVEADPGSVDARHRLAYASAAVADGPTRETLGALAAAYELAPYPTPTVMAWRVDLAERYWPAMPDALAKRAVSQVEAMSQAGATWQARARWCRSARAAPIAEAACESVPGVTPGLDLTADP